MTGKRITKITVTAIGTPPPLPLRPLVDESSVRWKGRELPKPNLGQLASRATRRMRPQPPSRESLASDSPAEASMPTWWYESTLLLGHPAEASGIGVARPMSPRSRTVR
jgi:hypothetical protein